MERELSLVEHLAELRIRIIVSLVALGISCVLSFPFAPFLLNILKNPASGIIDKLAFFSPQEGFLIYVNLSLFSGWLISLPIILYQAWAFISPAIEERQKKHIGSFIFFSFMAFICGGLFAYFILILGEDKIDEIGRALGKTIKEFKKSMKEIGSDEEEKKETK